MSTFGGMGARRKPGSLRSVENQTSGVRESVSLRFDTRVAISQAEMGDTCMPCPPTCAVEIASRLSDDNGKPPSKPDRCAGVEQD